MAWDYREKFEDHYGVKIGNGYVIHHIDFDHSNNDIKNLMVLPAGLHTAYHGSMKHLKGKEGMIDLRLTPDINVRHIQVTIEHLIQTLKEIEWWIWYKNYLDFKAKTSDASKRRVGIDPKQMSDYIKED